MYKSFTFYNNSSPSPPNLAATTTPSYLYNSASVSPKVRTLFGLDSEELEDSSSCSTNCSSTSCSSDSSHSHIDNSTNVYPSYIETLPTLYDYAAAVAPPPPLPTYRHDFDFDETDGFSSNLIKCSSRNSLVSVSCTTNSTTSSSFYSVDDSLSSDLTSLKIQDSCSDLSQTNSLPQYKLPNRERRDCTLFCDKRIRISPNTEIQLRFLNPNDYDIVKSLCEEWFPVEYPEKWFEAITSDTNLFSLAASLDGEIIGLIVSELKNGKDLGRDDRDLLCDSQKKFSVAYILSLGVVDAHRRQGIASLLLTSLLNYLSTTLQCKAVYLHVLTSNEAALRFYEKHYFRVHKFLPYYYSIGGRAKDGFTYVLYMNGGHGPWDLPDYVQHFCELTVKEVCALPSWCVSQFRRVVHSVLTMVR